MISPLPDGKYINLLSDMPVQAEGGMMTIDGEPVVIMQQGK